MVSVHTELTFGHLRYCFGDVPPQSNSAPGNVFDMECTEALDVIRAISGERRKQAQASSCDNTRPARHKPQIIVHDDYLYVEQEYVHTIEANV